MGVIHGMHSVSKCVCSMPLLAPEEKSPATMRRARFATVFHVVIVFFLSFLSFLLDSKIRECDRFRWSVLLAMVRPSSVPFHHEQNDLAFGVFLKLFFALT